MSVTSVSCRYTHSSSRSTAPETSVPSSHVQCTPVGQPPYPYRGHHLVVVVVVQRTYDKRVGHLAFGGLQDRIIILGCREHRDIGIIKHEQAQE